ncbi:FAD-binding oxidoreductase [Rhodococcus sp. WB9]|nr:FAD-binding oxidoreductase [Rhodococcus sp. WB9]
MRPATPDSLPSIGPVPGHRGLYIAAGHGMVGVTSP